MCFALMPMHFPSPKFRWCSELLSYDDGQGTNYGLHHALLYAIVFGLALHYHICFCVSPVSCIREVHLLPHFVSPISFSPQFHFLPDFVFSSVLDTCRLRWA